MPLNPALPAEFLGPPIAHRGYHDRAAGRPENSRAAFRAAVEAGYAIELDVQPSRDGVPMVFHDYHLRRLTGRAGAVRDLTAADLGALRLTGGDEGVPTLAEALVLIAGRVPVLVEIKDQDGDMGLAVGALERAVAPILAAYRGPVAVMSFNPHSVAVLAGAAPEVPRGLTTSSYAPGDWPLLSARTRDVLRGIPDYDDVGASFISHEAADLSRPRVADLRSKGAAVLCWTIRTSAAEAAARAIAQNVTFEGYAAAIPGAMVQA
jgi:glycerophosphoryl diester phosphodiesterase